MRLSPIALGVWLWIVVVLAAPLALPAASRPAQLVIPAGDTRQEQAHGGVAPPSSSGTDAARTSAPPAIGVDSRRSLPAARGTSLAPTSRPVTGVATWYATPGLTGAAGPALRRALGRDWRGQYVRVCADRCVTVRLTDWCACGPRGGRPTVIDLSDRAFAELAPLVAGVVQVRVSVAGPAATPPSTDR